MNIVITGATGGMGKALSMHFADEPSNQIIAIGRRQEIGTSLEKAQKNIRFLSADLSTSEGIQTCLAGVSASFNSVDILIHAAGGIVKNQTFTKEGIELTFAIQFLARLELTTGLMGLLHKAQSPKVLSIAGGGAMKEEFNYDLLKKSPKYHPWQRLKNTSVANDMMIFHLAKQHPEVSFYSYGPGLVVSPHQNKLPFPMRIMAKTMGRFFAIRLPQVVQDIQLILQNTSGGLFFRRYAQEEVWGGHLKDQGSVDALMQYSYELIEQRK